MTDAYIPLAVIANPALSPKAKLLFAVLTTHRDNPNAETCIVSRDVLATALGETHHAPISRYLTELEDRGYIERGGTSDHIRRFRLLI